MLADVIDLADVNDLTDVIDVNDLADVIDLDDVIVLADVIATYLAVEAERDHHDEEENRPDVREGKIGHHFRVGNKHQTGTYDVTWHTFI